MFDIGFWEISLIGVVALLVVGPERLPGMARNVGLWVGKIRRYVNHVREDIEREVRAEELKSMLNKTEDYEDLYSIADEARGAVTEAKRNLDEAERSDRESQESTAMYEGAAPGLAHDGEAETGAAPPPSAAGGDGADGDGADGDGAESHGADDDERRSQQG